MLTNYHSFMENKKVDRLRYWAFDWDDNILHMPTIIYMDKLVEGVWKSVSVLPSEFSLVRCDSNYRIRDNNPEKAYEEFRDVGPRANEAFLIDVKSAIKEKQFGPSWNKFIKCLTEASLFVIVTARGHEYTTLKEGIGYIIDNCLTKAQQDIMYKNCEKFLYLFKKLSYIRNTSGKFTENKLIEEYLDKCKYYGVGTPLSESFKNEFNLPNTIKVEEAKKIVLNKFLELCHGYGKKINKQVSVGFSDDDKKNVEHVKKFFEFKSCIYDKMKLNVYDTSNKGYVKTTFEASLDGKDISILKFSSFNTLPIELNNTTTDFSQPNYSLLQKVKLAHKLTKTPKKKFNKKLKNIKK